MASGDFIALLNLAALSNVDADKGIDSRLKLVALLVRILFLAVKTHHVNDTAV